MLMITLAPLGRRSIQKKYVLTKRAAYLCDLSFILCRNNIHVCTLLGPATILVIVQCNTPFFSFLCIIISTPFASRSVFHIPSHHLSSYCPHRFLSSLAFLSRSLLPCIYTHPPATQFAAPKPTAVPRTMPRMLSFALSPCRRRRASSAYRPDQAAARPALAVG